MAAARVLCAAACCVPHCSEGPQGPRPAHPLLGRELRAGLVGLQADVRRADDLGLRGGERLSTRARLLECAERHCCTKRQPPELAKGAKATRQDDAPPGMLLRAALRPGLAARALQFLLRLVAAAMRAPARLPPCRPSCPTPSCCRAAAAAAWRPCVAPLRARARAGRHHACASPDRRCPRPLSAQHSSIVTLLTSIHCCLALGAPRQPGRDTPPLRRAARRAPGGPGAAGRARSRPK